MSDAYDFIFEGFNFNTEIVFAGRHCGVSNTFIECSTGIVHFVKEGNASVEMPGMTPININKPSLVFFPRPHAQRIVPLDKEGVVMVCARTSFSVSYTHPIVLSFPEVLVIELEKLDSVQKILEIFFDEALSSRLCNKQITEKMSSALLVYMTRYLIENQLVHRGLIAALSSSKVVKALEIIHKRYSTKLTLDSVANEIGISRSQFAVIFSKLVEQTFFDYLTTHRIGIAKKLLRANKSVKMVAAEVGFSNPSGFIRKFKEETGISPGKWV
jgi:AraC-like DNA-binding protein